MLDFLRRKSRSEGIVLFRGNLAPQFDDFRFLEDLGVQLEPKPAGRYLWSARAVHPAWGEAEISCPTENIAPPRAIVALDSRLEPNEVDAIAGCGSNLFVSMVQDRTNVLHERKLALRMMRAVMGSDGVSVSDIGSQRFWSKAALDEELSHDAPLDIDSLYTLHAVESEDETLAQEGEDAPVSWLHSHGLESLGFFDFDILNPSHDVAYGPADITRALAYGVVEARLKPDTDDYQLASPGGRIRLVPASTFQKRADRRFTSLRENADDHETNRSVVCEPCRKGLRGLFGDKIEPSRWLQNPLPENGIVHFSNDATDLMSDRARGSYPLFRRYAAEFAEFEVVPTVKLGILVDGGGPTDREHLWFRVIAHTEDRITGELLNAPWNIEALKEGETYTYGLDVLSEWAIFTPAGRITAVEGVAARRLRTHRDEILGAMAAAKVHG